MSKRDVFFYSNRCEWCQKARELIEESKSTGSFVLVDIHTEEIPECVSRVPTIMTYDKKILVDDALFDYLRRKIDVDPFMINEMSGLSDSYSYLDTDSGLTHSFNYLNTDSSVIVTPTEEEDSRRIVNYEKFIADRDSDLQHIRSA